jgi:hypothetical protein
VPNTKTFALLGIIGVDLTRTERSLPALSNGVMLQGQPNARRYIPFLRVPHLSRFSVVASRSLLPKTAPQKTAAHDDSSLLSARSRAAATGLRARFFVHFES